MQKLSLHLLILCLLFVAPAKAQFISYSETFAAGASYCPGDPVYDNWGLFRAQLDTLTIEFISVTIKGDLDPVGKTCTDPVMVRQMAGALKDGVAGTWFCGPEEFNVGLACNGGCAVVIDAVEFNATPASSCACSNPGYIVRPCIGNSNWGGINGVTCGAATQIMTVEFEYISYCTPTYNNPCSSGDYIDGVVFTDINNTGTGCNGNVDNHIYYSNMEANIGGGLSYPITLTPSGSSAQGFGVWMDYNGDDDFNDTLEFALAVAPGTIAVTDTIHVPALVTIGKSRMRIRAIAGVTPTAADSCSNALDGETEDYVLEIKYIADIGVLNVDSPLTACGLSATENIVAQVHNFGAVDQDSIPLAYSINGGPTVLDTLFSTLAAGDTVSFTFTTPADLSVYGTYTVSVWSSLFGDGDMANDSSPLATVVNIPIISSLPYFQDFESGDGGWADEGTSSTWELGTPVMGFINAASSGSNAWVTNLSGFYDDDELSYLVSPCLDFSSLTFDPRISFSHIYQTQACCDEGWVEFSLNGGITWLKLGTASTGGLNWYNDAVNDYWNDNSGDPGVWRTARHELTSMAGQSNVKLRFVFSSDAFTTDEGFGIDDIMIWEPIPDDVGPIIVSGPNNGCALTTTENVTVLVENFGTNSQDTIPVAYSVDGGPAVIDTILGTFAPGDTATFTFAVPVDLSTPAVYNIDIYTILGTDTFISNDSLLGTSVEHFSGLSSFPFVFDVEAEPMCAGACAVACPLTIGTWENNLDDDIDWTVDEGGTGSTGTGPSLDNTIGTGTGNYLYTEASGCNGTEAILTSPCLNLDSMASPSFSFYYHMFGGNMGELYAEIDTGSGSWITLFTAVGQLQLSEIDPWALADINLSMYSGVVKLRFRGVTGVGFTSDMALDDIRIFDKPAEDVGVTDISSPSGCGALSANEQISISVKNFGINSQDTIPVGYTLNGGPVVRDTMYTTIASGATATFTFSTTEDLSVPGAYTFDAWTELVGDLDITNDSMPDYVVNNQLICCIPVFTSSCTSDDYIDGVVFAGISNITSGCNGNVDNYIYYSNDTAKVTLGNSYGITLTPSSVWDQGFGVWIDFNQNGDFNDAGEFVFSSAPGTVTIMGTVTIPLTATMGTSIMRVRGLYAAQPIAANNCDSQTFGETEDYNIVISPSAAIDAGITTASSPLSDCALSASEIVTTTIQNFGSDSILGLDVYYSVNGGAPVMETSTDTIVPGAFLLYTFSTVADLSVAGTYNFKIWTDLTADSIFSNDTLMQYQVIHNSAVTVYPFSENFDSEPPCATTCGAACANTGIWTNATDDDIDWTNDEAGTPSGNTGPNFDNTMGSILGNYLYTEASGCNLLTANLLSPCIDNSLMAYPALSFAYHMFGGQTGNIFIDVLSSGTWTTIDSIMGGQQTAQTDPWYIKDVDLSTFSGIIRLRIRGVTGAGLESDMAIDDIVVYDKPPRDLGVISIDAPLGGCLSSSETITVRVKNFGAQAQDTIPVTYSIDGGVPVTETILVNLLPTDTLTYSFTTIADLGLSGTYVLKSWTELVGDGNADNDTVSGYSIDNNSTVADFSIASTLNCKGAPNNFMDNSSNAPFSWDWDFGNGDSSTAQNPVYTYNDTGVYTVTLIVSNICNKDTMIMTDFMTIAVGPKLPDCVPTVTDMANDIGIMNVAFSTIGNNTDSIQEDYTDYSCYHFTTVMAGSKQTLDITTGPSWAENVRVWIDYNNDSVFTDSTELVMSSDNVLVNHSLEFFIPSGTVTNAMLRMRVASEYIGGTPPTACGNLQFGQVEDYGVTIVPNTSAPVADFNFAMVNDCQGTVEFYDYSSFFPTSWAWDFGDGNTDVGDSVTHSFTPGVYTVTLVATNAFGSDTITHNIGIDSVVASFSVQDTVETGQNVSFNNTSSGADTWVWDFGDFLVSNQQSPSHSYVDSGIYTISLISTNSATGCIDSTTRQIVVVAAPVISVLTIGVDEKISIAPMPSTGEFFINYQIEGSHQVHLTIRDLMGREILRSSVRVINDYKQAINLNAYPRGMYFVDLIIEDGAGLGEADKYYMLKIILE